MGDMTIHPLRTRWKLLLLYYRKAKVQGLTKSIRVLLKPDRVGFHLWRLISGRTQAWSNFYVPSTSLSAELHFCCQMSDCPAALVKQVFAELDDDVEFVETLRRDYNRVRSDSPVSFAVGRLKVWYVIVRLLRPNLVMETGVHDGLSSALILRALDRNQQGSLVSIDLPSVDLPIGIEGPGWLVPAGLQSRWILHLGDSRELLPALARQYSPVDIFIHDSDHSPEFQRFEYDTVRPFLGRPGLLLTDDAHPDLFRELAKQWAVPCNLVEGGRIEGSDANVLLGGLRLCSPQRPRPDELLRKRGD